MKLMGDMLYRRQVDAVSLTESVVDRDSAKK